MGNTSNCRKTQSRIGKHGSLRMPIRSLVNSSVTVEKGPTAIGSSPRHCCLSRGAFRSEPLTTHAMELSIKQKAIHGRTFARTTRAVQRVSQELRHCRSHF
jgi:hypothetical protein